jgi:hypothetical protein
MSVAIATLGRRMMKRAETVGVKEDRLFNDLCRIGDLCTRIGTLFEIRNLKELPEYDREFIRKFVMGKI